jgi:hypothetical protein
MRMDEMHALLHEQSLQPERDAERGSGCGFDGSRPRAEGETDRLKIERELEDRFNSRIFAACRICSDLVQSVIVLAQERARPPLCF